MRRNLGIAILNRTLRGDQLRAQIIDRFEIHRADVITETLLIRDQGLIFFNLLFQGALIAFQNADPDAQIAQRAFARRFDIGHGAVAQQQGLIPIAQALGLRRRLALRQLTLVERPLLRFAQLPGYYVDNHTAGTEDLIAVGNVFGRHLIRYHGIAFRVDVAVHLGLGHGQRRHPRSARAEHQDRDQQRKT